MVWRNRMGLHFVSDLHTAEILLADGSRCTRQIEIRTCPITGRSSRITFSRQEEHEPGTESLPAPPPFVADNAKCPFCPPNLATSTPQIIPELYPEGRMRRGSSVLFPNLYPYGRYSAVSIFDDQHFVEIGTTSAAAYRDCLLNCRDYLLQIGTKDPAARYLAITQNHLPSAGGSLLHPHLQIHADHVPANHQRYLGARCRDYLRKEGKLLFSAYLAHEKQDGRRILGNTGNWSWITSFAPEGFFEIWGILPDVTSLLAVGEEDWTDLASGIIQCQKFYRSLGRNGYNLGILLENDNDSLEVRAVLIVRSNYAPWVRSDFTGFELGPGDMATFDAPESVALRGRQFWP